jgi:site-specific DNA-methyltransferase (adenine-specific)
MKTKSAAIHSSVKAKSKLTKDEWREFTKTVWHIANTSHSKHPAVFPLEIPHRLIKLFSFYGESVLDPFAGTGTTAKAGIPLGRQIICVEQNREYSKIIDTDCEPLHNGKPSSELLTNILGDSRKLKSIPDESVDLVITSPPYWDKANYGTGTNNLGNIGHYPAFLEQMRRVFVECARTLKPGRKFCVVTANVNQYTDCGLLTFPLSTDFAYILREIGLVMVNEIIWSKDKTGGKWGSANSQRPIFGSYPYPPNLLFKNVHEYVLIFAKPPAIKIKNPKAKNYAGLMGLHPTTAHTLRARPRQLREQS